VEHFIERRQVGALALVGDDKARDLVPVAVLGNGSYTARDRRTGRASGSGGGLAWCRRGAGSATGLHGIDVDRWLGVLLSEGGGREEGHYSHRRDPAQLVQPAA
jgi:hypothetical protein